jgi:hypothetical protein
VSHWWIAHLWDVPFSLEGPQHHCHHAENSSLRKATGTSHHNFFVSITYLLGVSVFSSFTVSTFLFLPRGLFKTTNNTNLTDNYLSSRGVVTSMSHIIMLRIWINIQLSVASRDLHNCRYSQTFP